MKFLESIADMIGPPIVSKDIEHNGVTKTFYFRKLSGAEADTLLLDLMSEDDNKLDRKKMVGNIGRQLAVCLCDENGNAIATAEEINSMRDVKLRSKFEAAANEVNGVIEKKDSADVSGSGTSSPQSSDTPSAS